MCNKFYKKHCSIYFTCADGIRRDLSRSSDVSCMHIKVTCDG